MIEIIRLDLTVHEALLLQHLALIGVHAVTKNLVDMAPHYFAARLISEADIAARDGLVVKMMAMAKAANTAADDDLVRKIADDLKESQ